MSIATIYSRAQDGINAPLVTVERVPDYLHLPGLTNSRLRELGRQIKFFPGIPELLQSRT